MGIYFKNALIITMNQNEEPFYGSLRVESNTISEIGINVLPKKDDEIIDCKNNILMPGFKNAHSHMAMCFGKGTCDNMDLNTWLFDHIFPMENAMRKDDVYHLTKAGILESLSNGITSCIDMYLNEDEVERACLEMNYRMSLLAMPFGPVSFINNTEEFLKRKNRGGLVTYVAGFHAEYTGIEENFKKMSYICNKYKLPIFVHNSESKKEVLECKERHNGMTPTQYFISLGLFNYGGGGFHSLYLDEKDLEIYKEKRIFAIPCPSSNLKLGNGVIKAREYLDYGINVALGTDGASSNDSLDMFKEMNLLALTSHLYGTLNCKEILSLALTNGAKMMGTNNDCLAIGKLADLIMIDTSLPNLTPLNDVYTSLVYAASSKNIKMTMVDGKILYMDNKFPYCKNYKAILKKAKSISNRLFKTAK